MLRGLLTASCVAAMALAAAPAMADWPHDREITFVIPYTPGGGFDSYVRAMAPALEAELEREYGGDVTVVPENMPGAGGNRGSAFVHRAEPDGYTIGIFNIPGLNVSKIRGEDLSFDPHEITWLVNLGTDTYAVAVSGDSEANTIEELCGTGEPIKVAQTGPGSTGYITTVIAFQILGCEYQIVSGYEGSSEIIVAVMRGEVDASIRPIGSLARYVETGDLKMIMTLEDEASVEGVQAAGEIDQPEVANLSLERMIGGPPGMPDDLREKLSTALVNAANSEQVQQWAQETGNGVTPTGADESTARYRQLHEFYERYAEYLTN
ncbi:MAG TPA: tripartite tricarboxylate transporter substrate binding protein [Afifellaceae bacterium]|nr:tripartite tricarboxylate transporter substrate binding protein [Afifellaceae bacterium]